MILAENPITTGGMVQLHQTNREWRSGVISTPRHATEGVTSMNPQSIPTPTKETTESEIPHGYCHCGCGEKTSIATRNISTRGHIKGEPIRYCVGHNSKLVRPDPIITKDSVLIPLISKKYPDIFALVDDEDTDRVRQFRWSPKVRSSGVVYAHSGDGSSGQPSLYLHRFILRLSPGDPEVDHISGDGLDNRRSNLRLCTHSQNNANRTKSPAGTSRFKGVFWNAQCAKWQAQITARKARLYLGIYTSDTDAARAYDDAARKYFGAFARLNFPREGEQQA